MADPSLISAEEHTMLVSGNDEQAKAQVTELLRSFGWRDDPHHITANYRCTPFARL